MKSYSNNRIQVTALLKSKILFLLASRCIRAILMKSKVICSDQLRSEIIS